MKSILITDAVGRERHVGEEFDDFLQIDGVPDAESIDLWADRIRQHIRKLWNEDASTNKEVTVVLDAPIHYRIVVDHLQTTMLREEKIKFLLTGM